MEKFETQELLELVPTETVTKFNLTPKQTLLLGYLIMWNGLESSKDNGNFFRSNEDILNDIDISKPTLITSLRKLEAAKLIERISGYRNKEEKKASVYKINENNIYKNYNEMNTNNNEIIVELISIIKQQIEFQNQIMGKILFNQDLTHNLTHKNPLNKDILEESNNDRVKSDLTHNLTSDTETDIEIEKELNNIINKNNNIIIDFNKNKLEEKDNIINNIIEKEKENKTELDSTEFNEVEDNDEKETLETNLNLSQPLNNIIPTFEEEKNEEQESDTPTAKEKYSIPTYPILDETVSTEELMDDYDEELDEIFTSTEEEYNSNFNESISSPSEPLNSSVLTDTKEDGENATETLKMSLGDAQRYFKGKTFELITNESSIDDIYSIREQLLAELDEMYTNNVIDCYTYNNIRQYSILYNYNRMVETRLLKDAETNKEEHVEYVFSSTASV